MLHLRPHNRFEDLDGMYLVGGGTHPGSGLPVIFESARISARLLLADLGVAPTADALRVVAARAAEPGARVMTTTIELSSRPALEARAETRAVQARWALTPIA